MCSVCGCAEGETTIEHSHEHEHHHGEHSHTHDYGAGAAHAHAPGLSQARMVQIEQDILGKNNQYAGANRDYFSKHGILVLNLVSSPGSGKTTLLTETIGLLKEQQARHATSRNSGTPVAVIRSPTQRTGDAPAALRPPQTEHKAAQSWLPQMALRLFGIKF